jgi:Trk-type K+ transport system membrane component
MRVDGWCAAGRMGAPARTDAGVGPGVGDVGAYDTFAHYPGTVEVTMSLLMLFGRLEIFTLLAVMWFECRRR